jgi:hypothetical protein
MKRIRKFTAIKIIAALVAAGIPAVAAQDGYHNNRGEMQYQSAGRDDRQWNRDGRAYDRRDNDRRDYDRRDDDRGYRGNWGYGYAYAPVPVHPPEAVYAAPAYDNGYYEGRTHNGRTAAIIGGSAAAGALIGAAAGHGQGAVAGAIIGGIAGAAISAGADHHDRY